jgi:dTDP-4-dehydrorhamnose 3,5-epimerase-like enzyme
MTNTFGARIIELPKIVDDRGNLSFLENQQHIPFDIKRVYLIYDVPGGAVRGGHAYIRLEELIIAMSGSFDVVINDGNREQKFSLNRSYYGLYVPPGLWRSMENFSTNALSLVVASTEYDEGDYIRDFEQFKAYKR